jgi:Telomeric repeat-binding factor 2.
MNFRELLLLVLVGWTAVGAAGITISLVRKERRKAARHSLWIVAVWVVYMTILLWTSLTKPQKVIALGQDRCFDEMCFAVTGVQELPGYLIEDGSKLIRVSVRISNHGKEKMQSEGLIQAYLIDKQGRQWAESTAVSGVPLTAKVAAGDSVMSQPVFKVAGDSTGLGLIFTRGQRQPGVLVIGDSDSLLHQRTVVWLGR